MLDRKDIEKAISKLPNLANFGVGNSKKDGFKCEQELLLRSEMMFRNACKWLTQVKKIKSINYKHSSYGLKHIAEEEIGYVSNGAFIAAAIHCGFDVKEYCDWPNVHFNMSNKSINLILERSKG